MKFPNLEYAMSLQRRPQYEIAQEAKISEWRFSRQLNGRASFSLAERERVAKILGFDEAWLFQIPKPPKRRIFEGETTPATA